MKLSLILDIDGQYAEPEGRAERADLAGLSGVNGYCSDEAAAVIRKALAEAAQKAGMPSFSGIHIFGSGNYHYISKFFLETVDRPFSLLLFDRHPDMEKPAFPLLSCGSWVLDSLKSLPLLQQVYMIGVKRELLEECLQEEETAAFADRVRLLAAGDEVPGDAPLYVSIDKDVLSPAYAATDWDQGELSLPDLTGGLESLQGLELLGADICGDSRRESERDRALNRTTTEKILQTLSGKC